MEKSNIIIRIWAQDNKIVKGVFNINKGVMSIFDDNDNLLLRRTGFTKKQILKVEANFK